MKYKVKKAFAQFKPGDIVEINDVIMSNRLKKKGYIANSKGKKK